MKRISYINRGITLCLLFLMGRGDALGQKLSGKFQHLNNKELIVMTLRDFVYMERDTLYADDDGYFALELQMDTPGYIWLWGSDFRNEEIYLLPKADLHIEADCSDALTFWQTQRYTGSAALYNNFLADLRRNKLLKEHAYDAKTYRLPKEEFVPAINKYYALRDSIKRAFFEGNVHISGLKDFMLLDSIHKAYNQISVWRSYMQFLPKEEQNTFYAKYIAPYAYDQQNDWHYLTSSNYRWFFAAHTRRQFDLANEEGQKQGHEPLAYHAYYERVPELMGKSLIWPLQRYVVETILEGMTMEYKTAEDSLLSYYDRTMNALYTIMGHEERKKSYRTKISDIKLFRLAVMAGQPAFPFELRDTLGNTIHLADLAGKTVYVDFWASWCGPCIAEFPAARELEAEFKSDDRLLFISVSLDDRETDWRKGIKQHKPVGQQYWAQGGFKSELAKRYNVYAIPHYMLLDEGGRFVQYKAPRPSQGGLQEMLHAILKEEKK
ncbi:TlpA family protein disulfide reductase [Olivibacter sitiensis]|uniref:TlpA family protein disulfide reductase n=1 Tax=Olivibacter sitiensis TaxID=376470 RepID=UPI000423D3AC|nr:TlpA disulfide reductase family protein [Olivibacter sitiensis]